MGRRTRKTEEEEVAQQTPTPPRRRYKNGKQKSPEYKNAKYKVIYNSGRSPYKVQKKYDSHKRRSRIYIPSDSDESCIDEDYYLQADRMRYPSRHGKKIKPKKVELGEGEISKPYQFITRSGLNNIDQKLEARDSMSMWEYLIAFVKMLHSDDAVLEGDIKGYLKHLEQIMKNCQDGVAWRGTRAWSQKIFDLVEEGDTNWEDRSTMLSEMVSHTHKPRLESDINSSVNSSKFDSSREKAKCINESKVQNIRHVICRDWNKNECSETSSHKNGYIKWLHNCLYCYGEGYYEDHTCMSCPWKPAGWQPPPSRSKKYPKRGQGESDQNDQSYFSKN